MHAPQCCLWPGKSIKEQKLTIESSRMRLIPIFDTNIYGDLQRESMSQVAWRAWAEMPASSGFDNVTTKKSNSTRVGMVHIKIVKGGRPAVRGGLCERYRTANLR
jgi:hypothetical protein